MAENGRKRPDFGNLPPLRPGFERNQGRQPSKSRGKRVRVVLMNGEIGRDYAHQGMPPGWAADKCDWHRSEYPFTIDQFQVIG